MPHPYLSIWREGEDNPATPTQPRLFFARFPVIILLNLVHESKTSIVMDVNRLIVNSSIQHLYYLTSIPLFTSLQHLRFNLKCSFFFCITKCLQIFSFSHFLYTTVICDKPPSHPDSWVWVSVSKVNGNCYVVKYETK